MNSLWKERVLVQLNGNVLGPFPVSDLRRLRGFSSQTMISFPGSEKWAPAHRVLNQKIFFDNPLDITPTQENRLAPMEPLPSLFFPRKAAARVKITDFAVSDAERGWADRWFRRLGIFNLGLALAAFAAWTYLPIQIPLKTGLRLGTHQLRQWTPVMKQWERRSTLPSRTHALRLALQDFGKVASDLRAAFNAR